MKKYSIFLIFASLIAFLCVLVSSDLVLNVFADSVTTSVTVGNSAPSFTAGPTESSESSSTSPTNVGNSVTFNATGTDSNSEDYYLIVCSTNAVTANEEAAPTCDVSTWCVSSATTSGDPTSCSYTTLVGDAESNAWYAFVCDGNSSSANCSSAQQGSGGTGSPFAVNHAPNFSNISNDGDKDPGQTLTWSATAGDDDDDGSSDTVKLVVCKTAGLSGDACDGGGSDTWCTSSSVASNPSCGYEVPAVYPDQEHNAYVYVLDSHNFAATSGTQGSNSTFNVANVAPLVSAVTINSGSEIDLSEGSTQAVVITGTISDNNSCTGGELATVYAYAYRSGIGYSSCNTSGQANNNYCYPEISCTVTGGTCTGDDDASADYTCTVNLQYYADPTDVLTEFPTENWLSTIKVIDNNSSTDNTEVALGVELNSLTALDVTGAISYGGLDVGQSNDPLNQITTVTPTGNVGLDEELSGSNMCTDYPTCSGGVITVGYQKVSLSSSTSYASGATLTTSATEYELNLAKAESGSPTTANTWWGILIPAGTAPGTYSGTNTVDAVKGETVNW